MQQSDGKIALAGEVHPEVDFAVVRYQNDGTLDTSFGNGGWAKTDFSASFDYAYGASMQRDGKIVLIGYAPGAGGTDFALVRYLVDGTLDPAFGSGGNGRGVVITGTTAPTGWIGGAGSGLGSAGGTAGTGSAGSAPNGSAVVSDATGWAFIPRKAPNSTAPTTSPPTITASSGTCGLFRSAMTGPPSMS